MGDGGGLGPFVERGERLDDHYRLDTHPHHPLDEVDDVAGLLVLLGPVVGVVADAAVFVHRDLVALQDPFEGGYAPVARSLATMSMPVSPIRPLSGQSLKSHTSENLSA